MNSDLIGAGKDTVMNNKYDLNDHGIDELSQDVSSIYIQAAHLSLKKKVFHRKSAKIRNKNYYWTQSVEYSNIKRQLKSLGILLHKYPRDPYIRGIYFHPQKHFSSILKQGYQLQKENTE